MNRSDPTFREQTSFAEQDSDFINELFNNLLDHNDLNAESDAIPDLSILDR